MDTSELVEPPTKKAKLDSPTTSINCAEISSTHEQASCTVAGDNAGANSSGNSDEMSKEVEVGITAYVQPDSPRFRGLLKKRYTDFLVNEILPNGEVLHLRNLRATKPAQGHEQGEDLEPEAKVNGAVSSSLDNNASKANDVDRESIKKPVDDGSPTTVPASEGSQNADVAGREEARQSQ